MCFKFYQFHSNIKRDILVQKVKVRKYVFNFLQLTLIITLIISLDRDTYSVTFDILYVNVKGVDTKKERAAQNTPYQQLSILNKDVKLLLDTAAEEYK